MEDSSSWSWPSWSLPPPSVYNQNKAVEFLSSLPRFGHSTNPSALLLLSNTATTTTTANITSIGNATATSTSSTATGTGTRMEYTIGTIFIGGILLAVFLLWSIVLLLCLCLGPHRVGFLSGYRMKMKRNNDNDDNDNDDDNDDHDHDDYDYEGTTKKSETMGLKHSKRPTDTDIDVDIDTDIDADAIREMEGFRDDFDADYANSVIKSNNKNKNNKNNNNNRTFKFFKGKKQQGQGRNKNRNRNRNRNHRDHDRGIPSGKTEEESDDEEVFEDYDPDHDNDVNDGDDNDNDGADSNAAAERSERDIRNRYNNNNNNSNNNNGTGKAMAGFIRGSFILSCIIVMGASIASTHFLDLGFDSLMFEAQYARFWMDEVHLNAIEGETTVKEMILQISDYKSLRDTVVDELREDVFCPNVNNGNGGGSGGDNNELYQNANGLREEVVEALFGMKDFGQDVLIDLKKTGLDKLRSYSRTMGTYIDIIGVYQWQLYFFMASYSAISFCMMIGTILAWINKPIRALVCLNTWVLLPIMLVMVPSTWIVLAVATVGAIVNADFCSGGDAPAPGSPDVTIMEIVALMQPDGGFLKDVLGYWVKGDCASPSPIAFLPAINDGLNRTMESIANFTQSIDVGTDIEATCGRDFDAIRGYLTLLTNDYTELTNNVTTVMDNLSCNMMNLAYTELTHSTFCTYVPTSGLWSIGALFLVSFFSMWMITFRTAWHASIPAGESRNSSRGTTSRPTTSFDMEKDDRGDVRQQSPPGKNEDIFDDSPPLSNQKEPFTRTIEPVRVRNNMTSSKHGKTNGRIRTPKSIGTPSSNEYEIRDEYDYETIGDGSGKRSDNGQKSFDTHKRHNYARKDANRTPESKASSNDKHTSRVSGGSNSRSHGGYNYQDGKDTSSDYKSRTSGSSGGYKSRISNASSNYNSLNSSNGYRSRASGSDGYKSRTSESRSGSQGLRSEGHRSRNSYEDPSLTSSYEHKSRVSSTGSPNRNNGHRSTVTNDDYRSRNSDDPEYHSLHSSSGYRSHISGSNSRESVDEFGRLTTTYEEEIGSSSNKKKSRENKERIIQHESVGYDISQSKSEEGDEYQPVAYKSNRQNGNNRDAANRYDNNGNDFKFEDDGEGSSGNGSEDEYYKPHGTYESYRERYADGKFSSTSDEDSTGLDDIMGDDGKLRI